MKYKLKVEFNDDTADIPTTDRYYGFLDKYGASGTGNSKTGISTIIIPSKRELTLEELADVLGDSIPIISFRTR